MKTTQRITRWWSKQTLHSLFWFVFKYLTLLAALVAVIVPPFAVFLASFKSKEEFQTTPALALPSNWHNFENYIAVFREGNLGLAFFNTFIILIAVLVLVTLMGSMAAFVISRFEFRGRKLVLFAYLVAMVIPAVTTQVATFEIVRGLGLINTRWSVILLYSGVDAVTIFLYLQFMKSIPIELDEAALLEGASYFAIYWKVIFPLLWPATATVIILKTIFVYNEFYMAFLYMPDDSLRTVSTVLYSFSSVFMTNYAEISAGIIVIIIPTLVMFLVMQKQVFSGITNGAVKG
jgi:multiple sugar transport system permease protein